jgi:hypothetical protein
MLMVQYLYAGWSLPQQGPGQVQRWRNAILKIAKEEMAHFVSVQKVLRFIGGPLNFGREDFPFRFQLAPLDAVRLVQYVVAETPASPHIDATLVADHRPRHGWRPAINRVGTLYEWILALFSDDAALPDSVFRPDRVTGLQAIPSRFRADVGRGPLFVRTLNSRADAVSLLSDIASQRKG